MGVIVGVGDGVVVGCCVGDSVGVKVWAGEGEGIVVGEAEGEAGAIAKFRVCALLQSLDVIGSKMVT